MNVKRFTARNSREAMALVRQAFGDEAVVLSNKPCPEGVGRKSALARSTTRQLLPGSCLPALPPSTLLRPITTS